MVVLAAVLKRPAGCRVVRAPYRMRLAQELAVKPYHSDRKVLVASAEREDRVAEKAACAARGAESLGRPELAESLWRLVRRSRVRGLMFRAHIAASRLRDWRR